MHLPLPSRKLLLSLPRLFFLLPELFGVLRLRLGKRSFQALPLSAQVLDLLSLLFQRFLRVHKPLLHRLLFPASLLQRALCLRPAVVSQSGALLPIPGALRLQLRLCR